MRWLSNANVLDEVKSVISQEQQRFSNFKDREFTSRSKTIAIYLIFYYAQKDMLCSTQYVA